ncbi:hypothetical protein HPB48_003226 [Haemaphysalis longicornis]|uniref:Uncharacterized protein n=1 Tax=Haemaphysalis longicornis TaxID=44386 RepID=A0A9J6FYW4_HAELO|nr:hypothetical protein HPB48_003226 [Haemaphysalis longicornis]
MSLFETHLEIPLLCHHVRQSLGIRKPNIYTRISTHLVFIHRRLSRYREPASATAGNLLDFVPRGVTELILHVGTNDVASTNGQGAKERYSNLLDHIAKERPDIQATFVTLLLPRSPNRRRNPHDWRAAARFNREADAFNCLLVELCENRENVFFLFHCLHHFPPKMVLAADGLHPSFGGVSVMAWDLCTFLLELRRPMFADWQD